MKDAVHQLLLDAGCEVVEHLPGAVVARWKGMPVRIDARSDPAALRMALDATSHLPDPIPVAEIDLSLRREARREAVFVPIVTAREGHALRVLGGDSFLVILERESGDMLAGGVDASGAVIELRHRMPRASLGRDQADPGRTVAGRLPPTDVASAPPDAPAGAGKLSRLLPILRCVRCPVSPSGGSPDEARLEQQGERLRCRQCGTEYPVIEGVPILLADPTADSEPGPEPTSSNPYTRQAVALFERFRDGLVLDCGSGHPAERLEQVVHLERVRYPNVDVVASCDRLPFAERAFDAALCESVLEHVPDPTAVVDELHRVLKDGAPVRVDVPFLAPFHGYPDHYQNFTQSGLDHLLRDFEKTDGGIGPHQEPWVALAWMLRLAREGLPDEGRRAAFDGTSLGQILSGASQGRPPDALHPLPDGTRRALAAGFYFSGTKRDVRP